MEPQAYSFTIYQGATWSRSMTYKTDAGVVVDLSAYSARMTIRHKRGSAVILALTSSPAAGITVAATSPNLVVTITAAQTAVLTATDAVYDLEIQSPGGVVDRLIQGVVTITREITA